MGPIWVARDPWGHQSNCVTSEATSRELLPGGIPTRDLPGDIRPSEAPGKAPVFSVSEDSREMRSVPGSPAQPFPAAGRAFSGNPAIPLSGQGPCEEGGHRWGWDTASAGGHVAGSGGAPPSPPSMIWSLKTTAKVAAAWPPTPWGSPLCPASSSPQNTCSALRLGKREGVKLRGRRVPHSCVLTSGSPLNGRKEILILGKGWMRPFPPALLGRGPGHRHTRPRRPDIHPHPHPSQEPRPETGSGLARVTREPGERLGGLHPPRTCWRFSGGFLQLPTP